MAPPFVPPPYFMYPGAQAISQGPVPPFAQPPYTPAEPPMFSSQAANTVIGGIADTERIKAELDAMDAADRQRGAMPTPMNGRPPGAPPGPPLPQGMPFYLARPTTGTMGPAAPPAPQSSGIYTSPPGMAPEGGPIPDPNQADAASTAYWAGIMRTYLDKMTRPQAPLAPQPLTPFQKGAYMLNPQMRQSLWDMYQTPYKVQAQGRLEEEARMRTAAGMAGNLLQDAGTREYRNFMLGRQVQSQQRQGARAAALRGDTGYPYGPDMGPERQLAEQVRSDMTRKQRLAYIQALRDDYARTDSQYQSLLTNPNVPFLLKKEIGSNGENLDAPEKVHYRQWANDEIRRLKGRKEQQQEYIDAIEMMDDEDWRDFQDPNTTPEERAQMIQMIAARRNYMQNGPQPSIGPEMEWEWDGSQPPSGPRADWEWTGGMDYSYLPGRAPGGS